MAYRTFVVPRNVVYGPGALEALGTVAGRRALIVTDAGVRALGIVERAEKILQGNGMVTEVFDKVESDPSKETVRDIFARAQSFKPDLLVGLGGGSSMDAGKAAWVLYEHPDLAQMPFLQFIREIPRRQLRKKARYVAIATTSGTGSEVTGAAVVTDRDVAPPFKAGFGSRQLVPDMAIADPELAASMPPAVTANTGFDALVHAIECYVLIQPSDMIDPLALWSARTIKEWLPKAVDNGNDMQARDKMHLASLQAGMAFSNSRLGLVHGAAHQLGGTFGIPHGRANAFMVCQVFAFLYPTHRARLSSLARELGIEGPDDHSRVTRLLDFLDGLKERVGIPLAIRDSGLDPERWQAQLGPISEDYMRQLGRSPTVSRLSDEERRVSGIPISADDMRELFTHAWNGTRADLT